jgi:hypothetical protein
VIRCSIGTWWYIGQDKGWIPAYAEEHHSHWKEMLVRSTPQNAPRIEKKCLGALHRKARGGMTELRQRDGECTTLN